MPKLRQFCRSFGRSRSQGQFLPKLRLRQKPETIFSCLQLDSISSFQLVSPNVAFFPSRGHSFTKFGIHLVVAYHQENPVKMKSLCPSVHPPRLLSVTSYTHFEAPGCNREKLICHVRHNFPLRFKEKIPQMRQSRMSKCPSTRFRDYCPR